MNIVINNYNINYIDEGDGELVLLLHGWGANYKCFTNLINQLKLKYRVVAIDLPGFGESSELKESFFVDDYVDIIIKFVSSIINNDGKNKLNNLSKVILIGHSYGGRIIIKLNSRNDLPFVIDKNILIDAAGIKNKVDTKTKIRISAFKVLKKLVYTVPIDDKKKLELEIKLKTKFGSSDYANASKVMQDTLVKAVNEDLTPCLKNMKETLLIWGDNDKATPLWMARVMENEIKNAGLVTLNGGHFSYIDDPATFSRVIASYMKL